MPFRLRLFSDDFDRLCPMYETFVDNMPNDCYVASLIGFRALNLTCLDVKLGFDF